MNRENSRRSDFKKGIDSTEGRRRRTETTISLRKNKKDEGIAKRRTMPVAPATSAARKFENGTINANTHGTTTVESKRTYTAADIPSLMEVLAQHSINDATLLDAVRGFRSMLSVEHSPPVTEVLASGVLPVFVNILQLHDKPKVQFEAAWALTNIASTDQTKAIVDAGVVPYLAQLLSSLNAEVREQCAWCLGNIAGDSPALRDIVLGSGAMQPLLRNVIQPDNNSLFGNSVWALSNFCRGKPVPRLSHVAPAVPILAHILKGEKVMTSCDARSDALWALSYVSDGDDDRIQTVIDTGISHVLIEMLEKESSIVTPTLRVVGNIVSGNDDQTQAVIDAGLMSKMQRLLNHEKRMIRKEACWVLSNIAAGTRTQINIILKTKDCMQQVVRMAIDSEWEVRKEAIWAVSNIATGGTDTQVMTVIEAGGIGAVCSILNINDSKMLLVALDAVDCILKLGMKLNRDYASFVDECDGLSMIEDLQEHESNEVYQKAIAIIETYFGTEEGEKDENLAPEINGDIFSFRVPQKNVDESGRPVNGNGNAQPFSTFNFSN